MENQNQQEVDLNNLANLSGENEMKQTKYTVPIVKFNGNTGEWNMLKAEKDSKTGKNYVPTPLEENIEIVILKVRRMLKSYVKTEQGGINYYSNEHNSWKNTISLFERQPNAKKTKMLDVGTPKELKEKYSQTMKLKTRYNLYALFNDEIVKIGVSGKSLSAFIEYFNEFEGGEHMFQYNTKIGKHSETNEGGLTYYVMDFIKGELSDINHVAEKIKEVAENLDAQDKSFAIKSAEVVNEEEKMINPQFPQDTQEPLPTEPPEELQEEEIPIINEQ